SHPHGGCPFGCLPSHRGDRFPRSTRKPGSESRRLHAGCRLGRNQAIPQTRPRLTNSPWFRHRLALFDTSSAVRLRSSLSTSPDGVRPRLFRNVHHHGSLPSQLAVVCSLPLTVGFEGPALISYAAPHLHCCWCFRGTPSSRCHLSPRPGARRRI